MASAGDKHLEYELSSVGTDLKAVSTESAVEEIEHGGAPVTDEIEARVSHLKHLTSAESADVGEDAGNVAPAMTDPVQWKKDQAAMSAPRTAQQHSG